MPKMDGAGDGILIGASLLPVCIDPVFGNLYFWLGRERTHYNWPEGSDTWSDFGGRAHDNAGGEQTAAREFWEETCGQLRYFADDALPRAGYKDIVASLQRGEYLFAVRMWVASACSPRRVFITYVKQVPWDPHAMDRFAEHNLLIRRTRSTGTATFPTAGQSSVVERCVNASTGERYARVRKEFFEKVCMRLWSTPQLRHAMRQQNIGSGGAPAVDRAADVSFERQRFRACFLQMMSCVVEHLEYHNPLLIEAPVHDHT